MISAHRLSQVLIVGAAVASIGGCSGSSSAGGSPHTPSPNALNTAPAVKAETFRNVSPKANHLIQAKLPFMRGVASEVYYPARTLSVTFTSTADKTDQINVENIVRQYKEQAAAKPTKTAKSHSG